MRTILSKFLEILGKQQFDDLTLEEKGMYACVWYDLVGGHMSEILNFNITDLQYFFQYLALLGKQSYAVLSDKERYHAEKAFIKIQSAFCDLIQIHDSGSWYDIDAQIFSAIMEYSVKTGCDCEILKWSYEKYSSFVSWLVENKDSYNLQENLDDVLLAFNLE